MNNGIQDVINWILNEIMFLWIKIEIEVTKGGNLKPKERGFIYLRTRPFISRINPFLVIIFYWELRRSYSSVWS